MKITTTKILGNLYRKIKTVSINIETKKQLGLDELDAVIKELDVKRKLLQFKLSKEEIEKLPHYSDEIEFYKDPKPRFFSRAWRQQRKINKHPDKKVRVIMKLNNNKWIQIWVLEKRKGFRIYNGTYIFDYRAKMEFLDGTAFYFFHQDLPVSIGWRINTDKAKQMIIDGNLTEVPLALNPSSLDESQDSEVVTQVFESNKIQKWVKRIFIINIILGLFIFVDFMVDVYGSGIFGNLK